MHIYAKPKAQISCTVTTQLICAFAFATQPEIVHSLVACKSLDFMLRGKLVLLNKRKKIEYDTWSFHVKDLGEFPIWKKIEPKRNQCTIKVLSNQCLITW